MSTSGYKRGTGQPWSHKAVDALRMARRRWGRTYSQRAFAAGVYEGSSREFTCLRSILGNESYVDPSRASVYALVRRADRMNKAAQRVLDNTRTLFTPVAG